MSRISCDVTKDLLPSYLDEICSVESRNLVEEHLQECASCRDFLQKLQARDMGRETPKVDYLKKINLSISHYGLAAVSAALALLVAGMSIGNRNAFRVEPSVVYYYIEMPLLMLLFAFTLNRGTKISLPVRLEWLLPVCGTVIACCAGALHYNLIHLEKARALFALPHQDLGLYLHRCTLLFAWGSVLLLVILFAIARGQNRMLLISQNLAWLGLNLAMSLDSISYYLMDFTTLSRIVNRNISILIAEFVIVTALTFWLHRRLYASKTQKENSAS